MLTLTVHQVTISAEGTLAVCLLAGLLGLGLVVAFKREQR